MTQSESVTLIAAVSAAAISAVTPPTDQAGHNVFPPLSPRQGLRKPTLEEIDHSRRAIVTPSLFGSSLEEVMERQSELFPDRKLPWVQVQLSQYVLALGGAQAEGIFRYERTRLRRAVIAPCLRLL